MNRFFKSLKLITIFLLVAVFRINASDFTFLFMTDIHIQKERNAKQGFEKAIESANKLTHDFVLTGGDLVMDVLGVGEQKADSLYDLYTETIKKFKKPVYNTIGNHEVFGLYKESGIYTSHSLYGKKMYEKRLGKRYYSFKHKGWKFIVLDGIEMTPERRYRGFVDEEQLKWIKEELNKTEKNTPIVISTHIPLVTAFVQYKEGSTVASDSGTVIYNSKKVLDLFSGHSLRLVLQGHLHFLEDIFIDGKTRFITGGAVSAKWWEGPNDGMQEGYLQISIKNDEITWKYIDYGWEVPKN